MSGKTDLERVRDLKAEAPPVGEAPDYHWLCDIAERALRELQRLESRLAEARWLLEAWTENGKCGCNFHLDDDLTNHGEVCGEFVDMRRARRWLEGGE